MSTPYFRTLPELEAYFAGMRVAADELLDTRWTATAAYNRMIEDRRGEALAKFAMRGKGQENAANK